MLLSQNEKQQLEKLEKQVARYEAKGYKDTAAHQMLARLRAKKKEKPVAGVIQRNADDGDKEA